MSMIFFINVVVDRLETTGGVAKVFFNIDARANRWLNNRKLAHLNCVT